MEEVDNKEYVRYLSEYWSDVHTRTASVTDKVKGFSVRLNQLLAQSSFLRDLDVVGRAEIIAEVSGVPVPEAKGWLVNDKLPDTKNFAALAHLIFTEIGADLTVVTIEAWLQYGDVRLPTLSQPHEVLGPQMIIAVKLVTVVAEEEGLQSEEFDITGAISLVRRVLAESRVGDELDVKLWHQDITRDIVRASRERRTKGK